MRRTFLTASVVAVAIVLGLAGTASASPGLTVTDLDNGVTTTQLAQSLVGPGVTISNVTYTGDNRAAGTFSGGTGIIGFPSGIVLDSGKVQTYSTDPTCSRGVEGPNQCYEATGGNPGGAGGVSNSTNFGGAGDADLTALSGFTTHDATILEFDFVPDFATVQFRYAFSSDEYSDYSNTQFNDVFGFFVNGVNCATVPGTGDPVSINTINNGNDVGGNATPHNPAFFRDNVRPAPTIDTEMDGLTTVLECNATVNPGVTNHMKLAIADASDFIFDSAVFLQAGSLVSGTQITTSLSGGGESGPVITVPAGTAVTDSSTLVGANASTATGTVTYTVYSDAACSTVFADAGTKTVTGGVVPDSDPITFTTAATYYWIAAYSGDTLNNPSNSGCGTESVTVIQVDEPITAAGTSITATEGASFTGVVATFHDPDTAATADEYSAEINWGDGTTTTGTIHSTGGGNFEVIGTHTYAEEGSYTITVVITDVDNPSNTATATSHATVADAPLTAKCSNGFSGPAFAGTTATFTDANPGATVADFSATINWGDGSTTPGAVTASGGGFAVNGAHVYLAPGVYSVTTNIADVGGSTATTKCTLTVFVSPTGGGAFAIGDVNAVVGNHVTFWGAQWWKLNSLSGGSAPAAFKGFVLNTAPTGTCGNWNTGPGNSPKPPASVPAIMGLIVTSKVSQSGSTIAGNEVRIAVVQTDPGYAPNPGHEGTGTVLAVISC